MSGVGGEQPEWLAAGSEHAEVPFVERQDVPGLVASREHGDRGVREAHLEIRMAFDDLPGLPGVGRREWLELIGAPLDLLKKAEAGSLPNPGRQQIVELGEYERR